MANTLSDNVRTTGKASVRVEERPIRTYTWDSPSRYPILFAGGYRFMYPYTMEDHLFHRAVDRVYKQVILENEYIQVIMLPELGGHLWRAYDKVSGKEMFYNNHVVKPGLIGLRGAWCATGIEWNFPIGHSVSTVSTVDHTCYENPDGSVTAAVGDLDRTTRMKWTVKITVFPGRAAFRVDTVLSNPTSYPHRYMYWENTAEHATDGFQFIAPAKKAWTWGGKTDFPIIDGVDKSMYISHPRAIDYFALGLGQDYFGYYDHSRKFGAVHVADYHLMPGKKFFTWGMAEHARQWARNLTDNEGPYIELQCGLTPTQAAFNFFTPQTSIRWDEMWFPVGDLGYFAYANRDGALHFSDRLLAEPFPEEIGVAIVTNSRREGATVVVSADGRTLLSESGVDFEAVVPRRWKVRFPRGARSLEVRVTQDGATVLEYSTADWDKISEIEYANPRELDKVEHAGPATLIEAAIAQMKWFNFAKAMTLIDRALAARPSFTDGHYWKGNLLYNLYNYDEAVEHLSKVGARNANHASAQYLIAEVRRWQGRFDEASKIAARLAAREETAILGKSLLGRIAMQRGDFGGAAAELGEAAASAKAAPAVMALHAVALRRLGRLKDAEDAARRTLAVDPLDFLALNELDLLGRASGRDVIMRGAVESFIELACYYEDVSLYDDAAKVLEHYRTALAKGRPNPLVLYHLAYCNERIGRGAEAQVLYREAAAGDPDHVMTCRREDARALEAAVGRDGSDSLAHYLLGLFLGWKLHNDETLAHWNKALDGMGGYAVLLRNLGKFHLNVKEDFATAAEYYERAVKAAPADEELYAEGDEAYAKLGDIDRRIAALEAGLAPLPTSQKVRKLLAQSYYFAGRYDDALRLLMSGEFDHWEGDRMGHQIFVLSNIQKGKLELDARRFEDALASFQRAMEYPANLKVGKPAYPGHAPQLYLSGIAHEGLGQREKARALWMQGGEEIHEGWIGRASEEEYYKGLCLHRIGRRREARRIWRDITKGADFHWANTEWHNAFIRGLGHQGLGEWDKAEQCFSRALEADRANRKVRYHLELVRAQRQPGE